MGKRMILVGLTMAAGSCVCGQNPAAQIDLKALQGKWKPTMVFMRWQGKEQNDFVPKEFLSAFELKISGDEMVLLFKGKNVGSGKTIFDPSKTPKAFDQITPKGKNKGRKVFGIYQLDGDKLKICLGDESEGRPTDFTRKGRRFVMFLERHK